jgi:hypothetical protein
MPPSASPPSFALRADATSDALLFVALVCLALIEAALQVFSPTIIGNTEPLIGILRIPIALLLVPVSLVAARSGWSLPQCSPAVLPWAAGALCLLTGWLAGTFWPNSGDEHSYTFLADTLLAGRFSNPPPPDPELFRLFRVFTMYGHTFSQYPPGWPLVLAPFRAVGLDWLANPLLTVLLGGSLLGAMRCLKTQPPVQVGALILVLASPFVLFNGGSMFSHMLTAALAGMIVWQQLADEQRPYIWRKALIGALLGALLLTRYEAFGIIAFLYAVDRLWHRRGKALVDAMPTLLAALPFVALYLGYDWAITGDALQTPATLTNPDMTFTEAITDLPLAALRADIHTVYWAGSLGLFGGFTLLALQMPALVFKLRSHSLRFFDLALPAAIVFFLYFPNGGGHQYGPRYWFFAWPLAVLTVVTGLVASDGTFRLAARTYLFRGLVAANLVFCAMSLPGLIVTTRAYIDARRSVFAGIVPVSPALVLVPSRELRLWPWRWSAVEANSLDFARNDVDFNGPVLYGRLDAPDALVRACRLPGRTVLVWRGPSEFIRADCGVTHP